MEIDYDELFNIETGADIAESTADEAKDTAQETQETEAGQEAAQEENPENGQETAENEQETREAKDKKPEQTPEERARQAEGRRRREAEEAGRKAERAEISAVISRLGLTDPETGEAVDDYDKLKAYEAKVSDKRIAAGKANKEDIRRVVREEQQRAEQEEQPAEPTEDPRIRQELDAIRKMDPEMTDLGAILQSEAGERFKGYVRKGLGFLDAYKLAAEERLARLRSASAEEAARVKAASKDHLSATGTRGTGPATVPRDVEREYRIFFPGATQAEIQRMYTEDQKKYGKK